MEFRLCLFSGDFTGLMWFNKKQEKWFQEQKGKSSLFLMPYLDLFVMTVIRGWFFFFFMHFRFLKSLKYI